MVKCSHILECNQKVRRGSLALCHGARKGYDFAECFKWHNLDAEGIIPDVKRSEEWQVESARR